MAVKQLSTLPMQWVDANGDPYSGARLFFYQAGSSTKQNVYTDSTGNTAASNPTTLNSSGYPVLSSTVFAPWGTVGQTYKILLCAPGSDDPPASSIWSIDNVEPVNDIDAVGVDQWVASGLTPTYVSATQFTLAGDQTGTFTVGRRLKTANSGGTIYSTITVSTYGALTTVTVVNESGTLDAGLSSVEYGLLSATNTAMPMARDGVFRIEDSADPTKKIAFEAGSITTATTRTWTVPDSSDTFVGLAATQTLTNKTLTSPTINTGTLASPVINTAISGTAVAAQSDMNAGTSAALIVTPSLYRIVTGTLNTTTGGASVAFNDVIVAGTRRVKVFLCGVSTSGTSALVLRIGPAAGVVSTGYVSCASLGGASALTFDTTGFLINQASVAARSYNGTMTLDLVDSATNLWQATGIFGTDATTGPVFCDGYIALSGALSDITVTTLGGADTFDVNGGINWSSER